MLTADEMVAYISDCLFGRRDRFSLRRENSPEAALAYLDALKKLKYDGKALAALKKFFKAQVSAEQFRQPAHSALYRIQDDQYARGAKTRGESVPASY